MIAIYKKELRSYFNSVMACLFIAVTLALIGLYFTVYCLLSGYATISYAVQSSMFLLLISVPILTMRIIAEERKQKTDQLLITSPVSVGKIVFGKYLALLTIFAIPCILVCIYPPILSLFGDVPMAECYLALLGYFLFGAACIAIGVFVSSVTESQVIAAVLGFLALFVGYMMPSICTIISSDGNVLTKVLSSYDLYSRTENFYASILDISGLIYYITIIALFLFLTCQSIQKRRWSMSKKNFSTGVFSTAFIAVAVVLVVVVNMIAGYLPETVMTIDMTSQKIYSITDETKTAVEALEEDVTIYVLSSEASADTTLAKTISRYDELSSHINVEYKDTTLYPDFYTNYTDTSPTSNSIIVVNDTTDVSRVIDYNDIYEYEVDYETYSYEVTGYDAEGQLTSAISYVSSGDLPKVYAISGHGEESLDSAVTEVLEKSNITYETINLMDSDTVPDDAECIIINGPTSDFSEDDADKVIEYLAGGGKAIIVTAYTTTDMENFDRILAAYDMSIVNGYVVETDSSYYYQNSLYLLPEVQSDTLTSSVYGQYYIFTPYAQGILTEEQDEDSTLSLTSLLVTSDTAYVKTDPENAESIEKEDGDVAGPFNLAVYAEESVTDEETSEVVTTKLMLVSSSYLFTSDADTMVSGGNMLLFTSILNNMVDTEISTSVAVKSYSQPVVTMSTSNIVIIGSMVTIIIPVIILIIGIVVWIRRRSK